MDGFLAHTFSPQDAHYFLSLLFKAPDFLQCFRVSYLWGVWYIMQDAPYVQQSPLGVRAQNSPLPLDFNVGTTQGTVVPQRRWVPADEVDIRRCVEEAILQLPIFFVNWNGGIGFWLSDILQGRDRDLYNRDSYAPLGEGETIHIRINVSSRTSLLASKILIYVRWHPQWPSYGHWMRQIRTRDGSYGRNPITLGRFMRQVGISVDKFFNVSFPLLSLYPPQIENLL